MQKNPEGSVLKVCVYSFRSIVFFGKKILTNWYFLCCVIDRQQLIRHIHYSRVNPNFIHLCYNGTYLSLSPKVCWKKDMQASVISIFILTIKTRSLFCHGSRRFFTPLGFRTTLMFFFFSFWLLQNKSWCNLNILY